MNYQQTIEFLFSSLPMFQRIGEAAIKKDLTNIRKLSEMLQQPHQAFDSIHIAGTNGKGSTSHMLASIFQAAGYKTGLYTSPHYVDFRERIKVNGHMISEHQVVSFVAKYKDEWKEIQPSFFEITVAMAFDHFRNEKVDIAIIETGLGGRLDSTNIIRPRLSVITNIGYDHMQMLGNSLEEIASEKAGIIKEGIPVVIGEHQIETANVFIKKALDVNAPIYFATEEVVVVRNGNTNGDEIFDVVADEKIWLQDVETDMAGPYQYKNIETVIGSISIWNKFYPSNSISEEAIILGLKQVRLDTNMIGRWMILNREPLVITDAAHNADGISNIIPALLAATEGQRHFVLGFVSDKDVSKILAMFPTDGKYYWCSPDIPRGKPAGDTQIAGATQGLVGNAYASVLDAYLAAMNAAGKDDLVFVGGSSYVVGDFLEGLRVGKEKA